MSRRLNRLIRNPFIQGGVLLTGANFISNFLNYLFHLFVGRGLGPAGYGELATVFAYVFVLSAPLGVINTMIIRKLGEAGFNRQSLAIALFDWFLQRFEKWGLWLIFIIPFIPWMAHLLNLSLSSITFLFFFALLTFSSAIYLAIFNGLKLFLLIAFLIIATTLFKFLAGLLVLVGWGSLLTIYILILVGSLFGLVFSWWFFKYKINPVYLASPSSAINKRLIQILKSPLLIQTSLVVLSLSLLSNLDVMFIKKFATPDIAGFYGVWSLWAKIILYALAPLSGLTLIFTSSAEHAHNKNRFLFISLLSLVGIGLIAFLTYYHLGSSLILVIYGSKFAPIVPFLHLAAVFGFLYTTIHIFTNFYLAQKSKITLILPAFIPLQIVFLYLNRSSFASIMWVEIILSFILATIYLVYWLLNFKSKVSNLPAGRQVKS